jgi:DNA-binding XRE family transcriptional regulator
LYATYNIHLSIMYAMTERITFAEWLISEMDKRNLSQADLARAANVTRSTINGVVTETRGPGGELCKAIAKAFHMPAEEVFRIAGLLPPSPNVDKDTAQMIELLSKLSPDERKEVMNYVKFKVTEKDVLTLTKTKTRLAHE